MAACSMVYSGGLHHIQVPGELLPTPFKTIRVRMEMIDIAAYKKELESGLPRPRFPKGGRRGSHPPTRRVLPAGREFRTRN